MLSKFKKSKTTVAVMIMIALIAFVAIAATALISGVNGSSEDTAYALSYVNVCQHPSSSYIYEHIDGTHKHQIRCKDCGKRVKVEDCPTVITDEDKVGSRYIWADYDEEGEHQYYCKLCNGIVFTKGHHFVRKTWEIDCDFVTKPSDPSYKQHLVAHPNVLVCDDPNCNYVYGSQWDHWGFAWQGDTGTRQYHDFQYKFINGHYCRCYCTICGYTPQGKKATAEDNVAHNYQLRYNFDSCWMECAACHDVYDSGHEWEYSDNLEEEHQWWKEKGITCSKCGLTKEHYITDRYTESGAPIWGDNTVDVKKLREELSGTQRLTTEETKCPNHNQAKIKVYVGGTYDAGGTFHGRHEERCAYCGKTNGTYSCTMTVKTLEDFKREYTAAHPGAGGTIDWRYLEAAMDNGHLLTCSVCGGQEMCKHDFSDQKGIAAYDKGCVVKCKICGFERGIAYGKVEDPNDHTDPHTYIKYQDTYHTNERGLPLAANDNYPCSYENSGTRHTAKCDLCGYSHSEKCDRLGYAPAPGYPGQHYEFCSKCGGGVQLVSCTNNFRESQIGGVGYHEVYCKVCGTTLADSQPCDYILDKATDEFRHRFRCHYCGQYQEEGHVRVTLKENVVAATENKDGSYDLVTRCKICDRELTRTTRTIPKTPNANASPNIMVVYGGTMRNTGPITNYAQATLNGVILIEGITEYMAEHGREMLLAAGVSANNIDNIPNDFWVDGNTHVTKAGATFAGIILCAKIDMHVTDYQQLKDTLTDEEINDLKATEQGRHSLERYVNMTATLTFTFDAYYMFTISGTDYVNPTYLVTDESFDPTGHAVTLTLPTITNMDSAQTMYVQQTTDGGETYAATFLGEYASANNMGSVKFTTTQGFNGEFFFRSAERWIEYVERIEPTHWTTGQEAFYYSRNQNKYYHDILCTDEFDILDDVVIPMLPYTVSFDKNADDATGGTDGINGEYGNTYILPECGFALEGYTFYAWYDGYCTYAPGANYVLYGDTVFYAKWQNNESPATTLIVRFNKNADDAEGAMPDQSFVYGDQVVLKKNEFVRAGYYFNGWHFREIENESREVWLKDESTGLAQYATPHFLGTFASGRVIELYAEWNTAIIITYDKNGDDAQGEMAPQSCSTTEGGSTGYYVAYGNLANKNVYTRYMYEFVGWNTNKNSTAAQYIDEGSLYGINQNTILYAIWKKVIFEITFDKNADDATGEMDVQLFNEGINDVINQNVFVREGYRFTGWSTNANATSYGYRDGANTQFYRDTTLYAVWVKIWTITFDVNHDDVVGEVASIIADDNAYTKIPANELTLERFVFDGWYGNPECTGTKYYVNSSYKFTADTTLYAKWAQKIFFVSFDANGGEGAMTDQIVDYLNGYSTICPVCSSEYKVVFDGEDYAVYFCNCNPFGMMLTNEGDTSALAVRGYVSLEPYSLTTKFNELAASYAEYMNDFDENGDLLVTAEELVTDYAAFYAKIEELFGASVSFLTKDLAYSTETSAIVGLTDEFLTAGGETEVTHATLKQAIARLFGYGNVELFNEYTQSIINCYLANEAGAATTSSSLPMKYEGAVYTTSDSFVLPFAFRTAHTEGILGLVFVDEDGMRMWVSDYAALLTAVDEENEIPAGRTEIAIRIYGRCALFEAPKLNECGFTKDRYSFDSWNTKPDGSGTKYDAKSSLSSLKTDLTLYAQWKPNFAVVTFDANGGVGAMDEQWIDKYTATALDKCTFSRDGYAFAGWGTSATQSYVTHTDEKVVTLYGTSPVTYYALWKKIITVTFMSNGGYGQMAPQTVVTGSTLKLNENTFKHETLAFNFWSLTEDGESYASNKASKYISGTDDIVLYAIWKEKTSVSYLVLFEDSTVTYDGEEKELATATVDFETHLTSSGNPVYVPGTDVTTAYTYYRGTLALAENMLEDGVYPTDAGTYLVRFHYEDSKYVGVKDAILTIEKATRTITPTTQVMTLYGTEGTIGLKMNSDFDNSADANDVVITSTNVAVAKAGELDIANKNGLLMKVSVAYVGEGYATVTFTLPATTNYEEATASVVVIAKEGYDVVVNNVEGGSVSVDKVKAVAGSTVSVDVAVKTGWTLERIVVMNERAWQEVEVTDGKFVMPEATVSVYAEITQDEYTITYVPTESMHYVGCKINGAIYNEPMTNAHYGDIVTIYAEMNDPNRMDEGVVVYKYTYDEMDGMIVVNKIVEVNINKDGEFTFNMPAKDINLQAILGRRYHVGTDEEYDMANGLISFDKEWAIEGERVYITVEANEGYRLSSLVYCYGGDFEHGTICSVNLDMVEHLDGMSGETHGRVYYIEMPDDHVMFRATFITEQEFENAMNGINGNAKTQQGNTQAELGIVVDDATAEALLRALGAINVDLNVENSQGGQIDEFAKRQAIEALMQAGYLTIENGRVVLAANRSDNFELSVVEQTYVEVSVKEYDGNVMTLHITPKKQRVATVGDGDVVLGASETVDVTEMTTVTVGIPEAMALAAGGVGETVYVGHIHEGRRYEYPAIIGYDETNGYTATFLNPNGYSEFTLSLESSSVVSFVVHDETRYYPSFAEGIADALAVNATTITVYKMPVDGDKATVTKKCTLTFVAALGAQIDFDALYTTWLTTDVGVKRVSTDEQLTAHVFAYSKYYKVRFTDGTTILSSQEVVEGEKAVRPESPSKYGYTFDNWYIGDALFDFDTAITEETYIRAKFDKNSYNVTFDTNDGTPVEEQTVPYGESATRPATDPEKTGHTFVDWYEEDGETTFDFEKEIEEDTTVYAKYTKNRYTVTFATDGGSAVESQTVEYCDLAVRPDDPTKKGHTFIGWFKTAELETPFNFDTPIVENTTIHAKFERNSYHDFGEWTITKEAQPGVKGEATRTCTRCGVTEKREIEALPYVPTTTDDGEKVYNETVTEEAKDVTELFKQAKEEDGTVEIKATTEGNKEIAILFDNNAVKAIGDANVTISAKVSTENLTVENAELVLEVTVTGATFETGTATVSIPFEKEIPTGKVGKVYYIDDQGSKTDMNATFENGKVVFTTDHFSTYAVMFEDAPALAPEKSGLSAGAIAGIVIGAVIGVLLIAGAVFFILRKKKASQKQ